MEAIPENIQNKDLEAGITNITLHMNIIILGSHVRRHITLNIFRISSQMLQCDEVKSEVGVVMN
jgi:hypothetical protein